MGVIRSSRRFVLVTVSGLVLSALGAPTLAQELALIAQVGDPAPGFAEGTVITGFSSPPSISDGGFAALHVVVTGGVSAIYRWHRSQPLHLVARGTDSLAFATGMKTLGFLEAPIVGDTGWVAFTATLSDGGRGMVVWRPSGTLYPVAEIGQMVPVPCEDTDFTPCDAPLSGPIATMAAFAERQAAIFRRYPDGGERHEILFRGTVTATGTPEALFRWAIDDDGGNEAFSTVVSNRVHNPGGSGTSYFQGFPNLAACGSSRYALVTISQLAPLAAIELDPFGAAHVELDRSYTIDGILRTNLHCASGEFGYSGARSTEPSDHTQTKRGVFIGAEQVYFNTATSSGVSGSTIGAPIGQALTHDDPPLSIFAAGFSGDLAGKAGVWRGGTSGAPKLMLYETQGFPLPSELVNTIWAVHAGANGGVAAHAQMSTGAQAILRSFSGARHAKRVLRTGATVSDGDGGTMTIDSFWTLGGGFGADPVVTGAGSDGLVSAMNDSGQFVLLINATSTGSLARGGSVARIFAAELGLFADDFESEDVCAWTSAAGAAVCE